MNKITFVGDVICDKEMLKASKRRNNSYNFDEMFLPLKGYFKDSDYVIGNLETVISDKYYTKSVFSFCSPEELVKSLKNIGINALSLANNHVLDRGEDGIKSTIKYLKKHNIKYFGVNNKNLYIRLKNTRVCVLSYTDSTNYHVNKCNSFKCVNLLKPPNMSIPRKKKSFFSRMYHRLSPNIRININNLLKKKINPIVDRCSKYDELDEYINPLRKNISEQKNNGYYTVMYSHMGGQFNVLPGEYSLKMANKFKEFGVNSVISTHPHIIQKMEHIDDFFCFYSIGGMVISPTSKFCLWDVLPQYSLVLNYYFDNNKLYKITLSFLICVSDKNSYLKVYPLSDYYELCTNDKKKKIEEEFLVVYNRLFDSNNSLIDIKDEYVIMEVRND